MTRPALRLIIGRSARARPEARLVPLTRPILDIAVELERDPLTSEMATGEPFADRALHGGPSWACLCDGDLIGAGGLICHWPGRAEAWLLVSRNARPREIAAGLALARDTIDKRQRDPTFRRIEAFVRDDALWRVAFMEALGFHHEAGPLIAWGPDATDFHLYVRFREE